MIEWQDLESIINLILEKNLSYHLSGGVGGDYYYYRRCCNFHQIDRQLSNTNDCCYWLTEIEFLYFSGIFRYFQKAMNYLKGMPIDQHSALLLFLRCFVHLCFPFQEIIHYYWNYCHRRRDLGDHSSNRFWSQIEFDFIFNNFLFFFLFVRWEIRFSEVVQYFSSRVFQNKKEIPNVFFKLLLVHKHFSRPWLDHVQSSLFYSMCTASCILCIVDRFHVCLDSFLSVLYFACDELDDSHLFIWKKNFFSSLLLVILLCLLKYTYIHINSSETICI